MFHVNEYKIVFKRRWHQKRLRKDSDPAHADPTLVEEDSDGRYDTVCEIYVHVTGSGSGSKGLYHGTPRFTGIAKLHPNDQPDKIVGKKIALRNALEKAVPCHPNKLYTHNKQVRTAIWKTFWGWVASFNVDKKAEAIKLLISVKNLWLEIEGEGFYDTNGGQDFDKALDLLEGLK